MESALLARLLDRFDLYLLIFVRVSGLIVTAPVWSHRSIPVQVRVALTGLIAIMVVPLVKAPQPPSTLLQYIPLALRELLVGMVIGFVATAMFSAVQFAGQLLDINIGLSMVSVMDPLSHTPVPIVGSLLSMLQILIFLTINGHHHLLEAVVDSYSTVQLGEGVLTPSVAEQVVQIGSSLFVIGLKVAAPVLAALFLTTVALGVLNRAMPQMNVFVVGMPAQLAVGIFMLMVALPLYVSFLQLIFRGVFDDIFLLLHQMKG